MSKLLSIDANERASRYNTIVDDIANGVNLEINLNEVEEVILIIEKSIKDAQIKLQSHVGLSTLKNEMFFLKYHILERI